MIFMQPNASVLEIPLKFFPSRIFGYMAVALKMDYWTVPSVQFGYVAERTLEAGEVQTICDAVEHIVRARGLTGLLAQPEAYPPAPIRRFSPLHQSDQLPPVCLIFHFSAETEFSFWN